MFKKILAALALVLISVPAFAQSETCTYHYGGGKTCWGPGTTGPLNQGRAATSGAPSAILAAQPVYFTGQQVSSFTVLPKNQFGYAGVTYRCPAVSKWLGIIGGGIVGHVIGKNISTHGHNLGGGGALLGAYAGQEIACEIVQPTQQESSVQARQSAATARSLQGTGGHMCAIDGVEEEFSVKDPSTCSKIAGKMARAKVGAPSQGAVPSVEKLPVFTPIEEGRPERLNRTCYYEVGAGTYRFNAIDGMKIGPSECNAIVRGQREMPNLKSLSLVL